MYMFICNININFYDNYFFVIISVLIMTLYTITVSLKNIYEKVLSNDNMDRNQIIFVKLCTYVTFSYLSTN